MLVLTDVTAERELTERLSQERLLLEFVVNALEHRQELLDALRDFETFRQRQLPELLSYQSDARQLISELLRHIHTFKGLFAQASLPTLPAELHRLEGQLVELSNSDDSDTNAIKRVLAECNLQLVLERDLAFLREKLGPSYFSAERQIEVSASTLDALEHAAKSLYGDDSRMLKLIRQLRFEPLRELLTPHFRAAEQLARRQGKTLAAIELQGDNPLLDPQRYGGFFRSLLHVFRNAVDHGIEGADERLLADKDEQAHIRCMATLRDHQLTLCIEDDGRGLNLPAIASKARSLGIIAADTDQALSAERAAELILLDGFSSRENATELSGRGAGLAAVRHELFALGGQVRVEQAAKGGTRFEFTLPYEPPLSSRDDPGPLRRAQLLLDPLPKLMANLCQNQLQLAVDIEAAHGEISAEALYEFTAAISLGGQINSLLGLSIERDLLLEWTRRFEPEFDPADIPAMADSVGAEIANTLIGNATVFYTPIARRVAMGVPEVLAPDERQRRLGGQALRGFHGSCAAGRFILFCSLSEDLGHAQETLSDR